MKKHKLGICAALLGLLTVAGAFGQAGYTGPGGTSATQGRQGGFTGPGSTAQRQVITAADARDLRDDARVTLQGNIVNQISREKFTFRDDSGEITLEIDRKVWRDLTVGENDRVEVYGEVDKERLGTRVEIDVRTITKL